MLSNIRCSECGQALAEDDLTCWACGALTERGRKHKQGTEAEDDDEQWRRSVEEARKRREAEPQVDPDEALRTVLARQGVAAQPSTPEAPEVSQTPPHRDRSEYPALRRMTSGLSYAAVGAAVVLAVMAVIMLAYSMSLFGQDDPLLPLIGFCAAVFVGLAAMLVYYLLRFMAESIEAVADTADNSRRSLVVLRMLQRQLQQEQSSDRSSEGEQSDRH